MLAARSLKLNGSSEVVLTSAFTEYHSIIRGLEGTRCVIGEHVSEVLEASFRLRHDLSGPSL